MKNVLSFGICFLLWTVVHAGHHRYERATLARLVARSAPEVQPRIDSCRYEKGPWLECNPSNGMQKRILSLKTGGVSSTKSVNAAEADCPAEKFIERPCKKQCKYIKGQWSDCANGSKERTDKLRPEVSSAGCKPEKHISKHCKKQCTYEKSEWSSCDNGVKTKVLTLVESGTNAADCEVVKNITKQCSGANKTGFKTAKRLRNQQKNKQNRLPQQQQQQQQQQPGVATE